MSCPSKTDLPVCHPSLFTACAQCMNFYLTFTFFEECFAVLSKKHLSSLHSLSSTLFFCYVAAIYLFIKFCGKAFRETLRTVNNFVLNQL